MGYSKNPAVLRKIAHRLAGLTGGIVSWPNEEDPDKWAYKIRQGFRIAKRFPAEFPDIIRAAENYRIEVTDNVVRAIPKAQPIERVIDLMEALKHSLSGPQLVQSAPVEQVIRSPATIEQVISFWIRQQPSLDPIVIEDCTFSNEELDQLTTWASAMEPAWYVAHKPGSSRVMLTPVTPTQVVSS